MGTRGALRWAAIAATVGVVALGGALAAPYLYAEHWARGHPAELSPLPTRPVRGRWFDDYYLVETLDAATYAIGEPRSDQGNYSYLIVGSARAVLFDAGTGKRDIVPVVRSLTRLPVTVVPSHLHFDHVGALGRFDRTALLDSGDLRARASDGTLQLGRYEFMGLYDGLEPPRFRVEEWWRPGQSLDLGGRQLTVLHTPGHTPTSLSLYDAERRQLFCGDFMYPGLLYAFLPGASRSAYRESAARLLALLDSRTTLFTAHLADDPPEIAAPRLQVADLRALHEALTEIARGRARAQGFYPRIFPVRGVVRYGDAFPWNAR
ncbi:MAG: MBL fold metallo-hydrolase [Proteobacteria bacterium]|nr:MBL fold metallo-hydrolase [Pseudomonadota bacterium]